MRVLTQRDILAATQERSRSVWEIANPNLPLLCGTPDLARLDSIRRLVSGMAKTRTKHFRMSTSSPHRMRLTIKAQEFLEQVYGRGTPLWMPNLGMYPAEVHFDVNSALLFHALFKRNLALVDDAYVFRNLQQHPVAIADSFNAVFDEIREFSLSREYMRRVEADRRRVNDRVAELRRYFRAVRLAVRKGVVVRLELHRTPESGSVSYEGVYDDVAASLTEFLSTSSTPIGGLAWKIDFHPLDGFFGHLAMVVAGDDGGYDGAPLSELEAIWMRRCVGAGIVLDCSAPCFDLRFRGSASQGMARCLSEELDTAIGYLAENDCNFYVAAGEHMPSSGFGSAPPVHKWAFNAPENIPRLGSLVTSPPAGVHLRL